MRNRKKWRKIPVQITPIKDEIFSRYKGLIETDILSDKIVAIIGLGSGGSYIALELGICGVGKIICIDHDRLEVGNVSRHVAGLSHVGRYKAHIMADLILDRNPNAKVYPLVMEVNFDNKPTVRKSIKKADVVFICTDNRESRLILNRLCVEENKPFIMAAAFSRAYGGQIHVFNGTGISPCYQCFLSYLPEEANDVEISSPEQAQEIAYSDREVPVEPGLLNDIKPISQMVVKIGGQILLKDKETTLRSLDKDLIAPWYIWLNRREKGTPYEKLEPLKYYVDGMHILRWYGIDLKRNEACPVCGDFEKYALNNHEPISDNKKDSQSNEPTSRK
ncbi:MAG: ThiF family adenylyltransferase [Desulfobacteraceae bacterium]|nr:ThiF family adenylyltransferase [Desulfobacteraceae bacterium]MBC2755158.1 ThiF family adenylyltransferase [Desulfobacteraceae bacterium]